jgi:site-specific DNA-cytosine methylase
VKIIEEQKYLSETNNAYEVRRKTKSGDFCIQGKRYAKSEGIADTISTSHSGNVVEPCICASRGRNPENPSDRTAGTETEQRFEINENGTSNTLTSVQKDNYLIEPKVDVMCRVVPASGKLHQNQEVYNPNGLCGTLKSTHFKDPPKAMFKCRIRKLTPKECIRLMDFDDSDYDKIKAVGMSDSQIYKQCGNSIVVACLYGIFDKLLIHMEITEPQQISLFD